MATWSSPKDFEDNQVVNSTVLNTYISENLRYLFDRPRDVITLRNVGNFAMSSTSFTPVSTTSLRLRLTLTQKTDLIFTFNGAMTHNSSANIRAAGFDILMDGTTYASSLTGTPLQSGIWVATIDYPDFKWEFIDSTFIWEDVAAGTHYWDLCWKTLVATPTITLTTDPVVQFAVREF